MSFVPRLLVGFPCSPVKGGHYEVPSGLRKAEWSLQELPRDRTSLCLCHSVLHLCLCPVISAVF